MDDYNYHIISVVPHKKSMGKIGANMRIYIPASVVRHLRLKPYSKLKLEVVGGNRILLSKVNQFD